MDERETGLKPLNGFRLKAGLRRSGHGHKTFPPPFVLFVVSLRPLNPCRFPSPSFFVVSSGLCTTKVTKSTKGDKTLNAELCGLIIFC
jgi:hypothetical protein